MANDSWREADTGYIIYTEDDAAAAFAYSPDGVGCYFVDTMAELMNYGPQKFVRVGQDTWDRHYS